MLAETVQCRKYLDIFQKENRLNLTAAFLLRSLNIVPWRLERLGFDFGFSDEYNTDDSDAMCLITKMVSIRISSAHDVLYSYLSNYKKL